MASSRPPTNAPSRTDAGRPVIGITMGDPCGIGPEVILRALSSAELRRRARCVVLGSSVVVRRAARKLGVDDRFVVTTPRFAVPARDEVVLVNAAKLPARLAMLGKPTPEGGRASAQLIEHGVELALQSKIDALVTAPINKAALAMGGLHWMGHTEMLQSLTGAKTAVMTMVGGGLRVALATRHIPLSQVSRKLTERRVLDTIRVFHQGLRRDFGIQEPEICVSGLNPHAGEGGILGACEGKKILPAIRAAEKEGIHCRGPVAADVVFARMLSGRYDGVVAMYHDQGCIPVKLLAFESGVNVTLGLPIVRTSPDHGTAYDIVRQGVADPGSMTAAIELALSFANRRRRKRDEHSAEYRG